MTKLNYRTCFILSTLMLSLTCLCCAVQGLLLVLDRTASLPNPDTLIRALGQSLERARQTHQQVEAFWNQLQAGAPATCAEPQVELPALFVLLPDEAHAFPRLDEAAGWLNYAIDQTAWAIMTWEAVCATGQPPPECLAEGLDHIEKARQALDEAGALLVSP